MAVFQLFDKIEEGVDWLFQDRRRAAKIILSIIGICVALYFAEQLLGMMVFAVFAVLFASIVAYAYATLRVWKGPPDQY